MRLAALSTFLFAYVEAGAVADRRMNFPGEAFAGEHQLALRGAGLMTAGLVFRVYEAALYLPPDVPSARVLDDVPKRLEIVYLRALPRGVLIEAAAASLDRVATPAEREAIAERLSRINALYEDVRPGDRYTLTYRPGTGSELALNGRLLGTIEGADFAATYFAIWLGERSLRPDLRLALLNLRP